MTPPATTPPDSSPLRIAADIAAIGRISAVPTILHVISEITGLRLTLVARVTQSTWTCCAVLDRMNFGLQVGGTLEVATTLCSEVRDSHAPIIIEHASAEPEFCTHPTPRMYGLESYIAVPIFRGTEYFGNVCALDSRPAVLRDEKTLAMLRLFAQLIALQLEVEEQAGQDREALTQERETAEMRERFIAVLGHDLRNPLFAILAGSGFLLGMQPEPAHRTVLERIRTSGQRMAGLIDELMDFARGRLGRGIPVEYALADAASLMSDVTDEIRAAHPARSVQMEVDVPAPIRVDRSRIAQLLSNLLGNAVEHGEADAPVLVRAAVVQGELALSVTSRGPYLPPEVRQRLFHPFARARAEGPRTGLGLGLYISSEIARAHGGTIAVDSDAGGVTTVTVRLPHALVHGARAGR
ncbi:MAG: histidine kinase [Gemmatimonadetes bacterium]|jgi:signal transduction histidine kinase|nr:histidine kinase [Gemmatimonadota bacterium]